MKLITFITLFFAMLFMYGEMNILEKIDNNNLIIEDQKMTVMLNIFDNAGNKSSKTLVIYQKNNGRRLVFFTKPIDDMGIGFLSLPNNEMYMYLPAYSTIKKIASNIKNSSFAGTDFSYEDMEIREYSKWYDYTVSEESDSIIILALELKKNKTSDYKRIILEVNKALSYPQTIKYFNKSNKHIKTLEQSDFITVKGYVYAKKAIMSNINSNSKTIMSVNNVEINSGIDDDFFSTRTLERGL